LIDPSHSRPAPRWLHVWAIVTVVAAAVLLLVGQMVTTLRAGMVDPDWPTRPWHLALESSDKWTAGYLVEHTHRILGFLVGGLMSVLALGVWAYEPRKGLRWAALVGIIALLLGYGYFHGQMMAQIRAPAVQLPIPSTVATLVPLAFMLGVCVAAARRAPPGTAARILAVVALIAVMTQGLLGGLRVRLNDLIGADLATIHGTFATLVLALLIAIPVLTARPPDVPLPDGVGRKLAWQTACLVLFTLVQIGWGALVRHTPDTVSTRMHLLFAFVVVGFATLAIKQAMIDPVSKRRFRWVTTVMMGLITLQILFGIEAWVGKFMTGESPDLQKALPVSQAILRTAHAHVGAWILAVGVIFALVARRGRAEVVGPQPDSSVDWQASHARYAATGVRSAR
jgi:heme a synthase